MEKQQAASRSTARTQPQEPRMFRVYFHNDNITTMEFVVMVLRVVFFKSEGDAEKLMLTVHRCGKTKVGTYPYDIAVSKKDKAMRMAKEAGYPLRITCEE